MNLLEWHFHSLRVVGFVLWYVFVNLWVGDYFIGTVLVSYIRASWLYFFYFFSKDVYTVSE